MEVRFTSRKQLTPHVWEYRFTPERQLDYVAGQYINLYLPPAAMDARGTMRTFTLTSLPEESELSFVVYRQENASIYKQTLYSLEPGARGHIDDAMGDVILPKLATVPLVFVAGGIGMASFVGMMRQLLSSSEQRNIHLLYSLRDSKDDAFKELISAFQFISCSYFVSPNRVHLQHIMSILPSDGLLYLSGSQTFVESLRTDAEASRIDNSRIVFDFFDGYTEL